MIVKNISQLNMLVYPISWVIFNSTIKDECFKIIRYFYILYNHVIIKENEIVVME